MRKVIFAGSIFLAILLFFSIFYSSVKKASIIDPYISPIVASVIPLGSSLAPIPVQMKRREALKTVTLIFGGDMIFDRSIRTAMRKRGNDFPLAPLKDLFAKSDLVVANLEGPITENVSKSEGSVIGSRENYFFTFDPSVAEALKDAGVSMVNLGNNHILNFGEDGVAQTKKYLEEAGIGYFGAPTDTGNRYWIREVNGMQIAFVNYNQFVSNGKEKALADIAEAKSKSDFVVLYTHWGKEYVPALQSVKDLAHEFVSAGADLIIGSHPHVVQEHEIYHEKTIYYSLGNLVFDQYDSEETKNGLLVRASIDVKTKAVSIEEIPVNLKSNGQTIVKEGVVH
jgi:poly-gamma-glutamate synthesis protein (capsule biosynthesis protein)